MKAPGRFTVFVLTTCLLISLIAVSNMNAQPVDTIQAKLVAKNFFADRLSRSSTNTVKGISSKNLEMFLVYRAEEPLNVKGDLTKGSQATTLYYVLNVRDMTNPKDKNGFIIVSADQRVPAVLGYSFIGEFSENDLAPAFREWMDHYKEQIIYAVQNNLMPDREITDQWKRYLSTIEVKGTEQLSEVSPLLTTRWTQRGYYNNLCPYDITCSGDALNYHVPAGCVAVAMAQIMKYHGYPASNNPIPGYDDPVSYYADGTPVSYGTIPAISVTAYDWSNMPHNVDLNNPVTPSPSQINAVSTLVYHCGVSIQMNYGPPPKGSGGGSPSTSVVENAFIDYFKYSQSVQKVFKSGYSDIDWTDLLRNELNNNRPVYYAGYSNDNLDNGHAFVCDGYQDIDSYFHFNWGFGPGPDGYYYLNDLTPGTTRDYTYSQWAIIGISPGSGSGTTVSDADGNQYNTVTIGEQIWMASNLKTTRYNDGTGIPLVTINSEWTSHRTPAYCWYDNEEATYKNVYGALYNWYAVNTGKLCPSGWHVPNIEEWRTLISYLGGKSVAGGKLKETGTVHWASPNAGATNETGFTALPGGYRDGLCWSMGIVAEFWSSTQSGENAANDILLRENIGGVLDGGNRYLMTGYSVRCLKGDAQNEILPGDAGAYAYGFIGTEGEEKWFRFMPGIEGDYIFQTHGSTDTYMYLYQSDRSTIIAEDNDGAGFPNSKIAVSLSANTWYYIRIRGYDNSVTGSYSVNVIALPAAPTAGDHTVCSDGTVTQTLPATASAPAGSTVVWFTTAEGSETTASPVMVGVGTITYYAASQDDETGYYSLTRTPVTLTINALPTATISGTTLICEETSANLVFTLTGVPPWSITYTNGSSQITTSGILTTPYTITVAPVVTTTYSMVAVSDANCSGTVSGSATVIINSDPVIENIIANPVDPIALINQTATVHITANLVDIDDNLTSVTFDFGDGSIPETTSLTGTDAALQVSHIYNRTGVFAVNVTLSDGCASVESTYNYVVVYDPEGGFVTGGGWINSPSGAYAADPSLAGKATFGFESRYKKGANVPSGNTEFQFHAAGMNFKSISYEWLVISGSKAKFKGTGTINGAGNYNFMLTAIDGIPDKFRIKIWDLTTDMIVYDNETGANDILDPVTAISGGSIVVHSPNNKKDLSISGNYVKAYPNPFDDYIRFDLQMDTDSRVSLEIYSIDGTKIATIYDDAVVAHESYTFEYVANDLLSGIVIYRFIVNGQQMLTGELIHR